MVSASCSTSSAASFNGIRQSHLATTALDGVALSVVSAMALNEPHHSIPCIVKATTKATFHFPSANNARALDGRASTHFHACT
eukprot:jgi/Pico_ML_1/53043/g3662.t1